MAEDAAANIAAAFFQASRSARAVHGPRWPYRAVLGRADGVAGCHDLRTTAADMLEDLDEELNERGISLVFAEMKDPVRAKIDRYKLTRTIDPEHFFPTAEDAVAAYRTLISSVPGEHGR